MPEAQITTRSSEARLIALLDEMIERHELLIASYDAQADAVRHADADALAAVTKNQAGLAAEIEQLEMSRRRIVADLAQRLGLDPRTALSVSDIAEHAPPAERDQLLERRERLRTLIEEARGRGAIVRQASEMVRTHVAGLLQRIQLTLHRASTYGRNGRVGGAPAVSACIDVRE